MPKDDVTVDHYAALNIPQAASAEDIKKQFRRLALLYHPDRNIGREAEFHTKFQAIQAAHEILIDPTRRKVYDRSRLLYTTKNSVHTTQNRTTASHTTTTKQETTSKKASNASQRPTEGPFSARYQWNARHQNSNNHHPTSNGRGKTTSGVPNHDRAHERFNHEEVPRTPKKTRDKPYASKSQPSTPQTENRRDGRSHFFADRNPREKEWMNEDDDNDNEAYDMNTDTSRSKSMDESQDDSWNVPPRTRASAYSFTPRTRTNPVEPLTTKFENLDGLGGKQGTTKTRVGRDPAPSDHPIYTAFHPRQSSTASTTGTGDAPSSATGTERRRFSYLFTDDGIRKPHRNAKQPEVEDETDDDDHPTLNGKNVFASKARMNQANESKTRTRSRPGSVGKEWPKFSENIGTTTFPVPSTASPVESPTFMDLNRGTSPTKNQTKGAFGVSPSSVPAIPETVDSGKANMPNGSTSSPRDTPLKFDFSNMFSNANVNSTQEKLSTFSISDWSSKFTTMNPFAPPPSLGQIPILTPPINPYGFQDAYSPQKHDMPQESGTKPNTKTSWPHESETTMKPPNVPFSEQWKDIFTNNGTNPFNVSPMPLVATPRFGAKGKAGKNALKKVPLTTQLRGLNISKDGSSQEQKDEPVIAGKEKLKKDEIPSVAGLFDYSDEQDYSPAPSPMAMDLDSPASAPVSTPTADSINSAPFAVPRAHGVQFVHKQAPVSPIQSSSIPVSIHKKSASTQLPPPSPPRKPVSPKKQKIETSASSIDLRSLKSIPPLTPRGSANGVTSDMSDLADTLPFESRPSPFPNVSPPSSPKKRMNPDYVPPFPPRPPQTFDRTSYSKYCNLLNAYQVAWNEYNGKVIAYLESKLMDNITDFAQNLGFASGGNDNASLSKDYTMVQDILHSLDEDSDFRGKWETAQRRHRQVYQDWKAYLVKFKASTIF